MSYETSKMLQPAFVSSMNRRLQSQTDKIEAQLNCIASTPQSHFNQLNFPRKITDSGGHSALAFNPCARNRDSTQLCVYRCSSKSGASSRGTETYPSAITNREQL
jgi:hypothetical protein